MSKSVWVIEQGEYSAYRVVGVYSSRENAEMVAAKIEGGYDKPEVSEWTLDPDVDELRAGFKPFSIRMSADGTVEHCEEASEYYEWDVGGKVSVWPRTQAASYRNQKGVQDAVTGTILARDAKHAIKIANEHRVQWLASGELS